MALTKILGTTLLAGAIATGSLLPLSQTANARDWDRGAAKANSQAWRGDNGWRNDRYGGRDEFRGRNWRRSAHRHRDHRGRNLALGAFAAIVGLAIAAEVNRDRYDDDY